MKDYKLYALWVIFFIGCASSQKLIQPIKAIPVKISLESTALASDFSIKGTNYRVRDGIPEAVVSLQNTTSHRCPIEYKFVWKDKDGFPVGDGEQWIPWDIGSYDILNLSSNAPEESARMVTVRVRETN